MRLVAAWALQGPAQLRRKNPQPPAAGREKPAEPEAAAPELRPEHVRRSVRAWPRTPQGLVRARALAEDLPAVRREHFLPRAPVPFRHRAPASMGRQPCGPSSNPLWASDSGRDWETESETLRSRKRSGSSVRTGQTAPETRTRPRKQGPTRMPMRERSMHPAFGPAKRGMEKNQKVGYSYKSASSDAWR